MALILSLDVQGNPQKWVSWQDAVTYQAKDQVAWSLGENFFTFHGGRSRLTGDISQIITPSIIAVKNDHKAKNSYSVPTLSNRGLFRRDRQICAYCGKHFSMDDLTRDHVKPRCQNGPDVWTNVVAACRRCNQHKDGRTPEQAGMELLFVPYVPSKAEHLILMNRHILADQMDFLMNFVPKNSRLHTG
jgi:hypothetical protein